MFVQTPKRLINKNKEDMLKEGVKPFGKRE